MYRALNSPEVSAAPAPIIAVGWVERSGTHRHPVALQQSLAECPASSSFPTQLRRSLKGAPTAGGLAAGVLDALKQKGGIWFGWSGEITEDAAAAAHVERTVGSITLDTGRSGSQRLRRVLPRLRQRHAMANAALSGRPCALRLGGVFRVSPGEHAVRTGARPTGATA